MGHVKLFFELLKGRGFNGCRKTRVFVSGCRCAAVEDSGRWKQI